MLSKPAEILLAVSCSFSLFFPWILCLWAFPSKDLELVHIYIIDLDIYLVYWCNSRYDIHWGCITQIVIIMFGGSEVCGTIKLDYFMVHWHLDCSEKSSSNKHVVCSELTIYSLSVCINTINPVLFIQGIVVVLLKWLCRPSKS